MTELSDEAKEVLAKARAAADKASAPVSVPVPASAGKAAAVSAPVSPPGGTGAAPSGASAPTAASTNGPAGASAPAGTNGIPPEVIAAIMDAVVAQLQAQGGAPSGASPTAHVQQPGSDPASADEVQQLRGRVAQLEEFVAELDAQKGEVESLLQIAERERDDCLSRLQQAYGLVFRVVYHLDARNGRVYTAQPDIVDAILACEKASATS